MVRTKYRGVIRELLSEMRFYIRFDIIHYDPDLTTGNWKRDLKFAKLIYLFAKTDIDCGIGVKSSGYPADENTDEDVSE